VVFTTVAGYLFIMENKFEHLLPEGQTELTDSIILCDDLDKCETCSNFLFNLSETHIRSFIEGDDFTFDCSTFRIVIPNSEENIRFFTIEGIKQLFIELSERQTDEEKKYVNWEENSSIVIITPFFVNDEVGLCIDILMKPFLDVYKLFFMDIRLDKLQTQYPNIEFQMRDVMQFHPFNDNLLDLKIANTEITSFLKHMSQFLNKEEMDELKFILCWGVFDVDIDTQGSWYVSMLDLNQKSKLENKPGDNSHFSLDF